MFSQTPKASTVKVEATVQSQPPNGETKHQFMPGAFADGELLWILTSEVGEDEAADDDLPTI